MTPQASRDDFAERVVTDYDALPPGYVERLQAAMDETMNRYEGVSEQSA